MCSCGLDAIRPTYSIPQLAALSGMSRWRVGRLLEKNGVPLQWSGTRRVVPLAALRASLPWIFDSVLESRALRTG